MLQFHCTFRISTELASISGQQHVGILQKKRSNDNLHPQSNSLADNISGDLHQQSIRCLLLPFNMNVPIQFVVLHGPRVAGSISRAIIVFWLNHP